MRTTLYQVNEAACPQHWREVSEVGRLDRLRSFVAFVEIDRDAKGNEIERREVARGQA